MNPHLLAPEDEREVTALIVRYATSIDFRDWVSLRTCFTDDFEGEFGPLGPIRGGEEVTTRMEAAHSGVGPSLHRVSNIVIMPTPGGARGRTYVHAVVASREPGGPTHHAFGYYEDTFIRSGGDWKIKTRHYIAVDFH